MDMDDAEIERQIDAHIDRLASQYEASSLGKQANECDGTSQTRENASSADDAQERPQDDTGPRPELPPSMVIARSQTSEDILAELNKSPLFMTELEENDDVAALQALAYEGTPLENAEGFRERGNECFRARGFRDALEFYGKGIGILAVEERKRVRAAAATTTTTTGSTSGLKGETAAQEEKADEGEEKKAKKESEEGQEKKESEEGQEKKEKKKQEEEREEGEDEDEVREERRVLEAMYSNRAACHLELRNYRSCWLDCASAIRLNPRNVKAYYRSARALLAVDRIAEADDACSRGLALDAANAALRGVAADIASRARALDEKARRERERQARKAARASLLKAALAARGIETRATDDPPDMEDARVRLAPDEDDPASELVVPTMLLYPLRLESDFVKAFGETETLEQHLGYILPPPWDEAAEYGMGGVVCYVETREGGLMKMGKRVSLLKVLSGGKVVLVDQVMKIFVLPAARADAWAKEFKEKRAAERARR